MPSVLTAGSKGPDVRQWQALIGVAVDGDFGPQTEAATKSWQAAHGLVADGVVGPQSWSVAMGSSKPPVSGGTTIAKVRGIEHLSASDLRALVAAANWIGVNPDWLATAISFETGGTFSPSIENRAGSGAVGLIQFIRPTAVNLGTTTDALKRMTFQQQLEYVKRYFAPMRGKLHSLDDVYLYIFSPKGIGQPGDYVMYSSPSTAYTQNVGFDHDQKGYITKSDVTSSIDGLLRMAMNDRLAVPAAIAVGTMLVAGLFIAAALYEMGKQA